MEFYTPDSRFHHNYLCDFSISGIAFNSVTQYLNYRKAVVFENETIATTILETDDPVIQTQLSSLLKRFSATAWKELCHKVYYDGTLAKFAQNNDLRTELFGTEGKLLVEVNIHDSVWGNGLKITDIDNSDPVAWRGGNWGGYLLTEVREKLLSDSEIVRAPFIISWTWDDLRNDTKSRITVLERMKKYSLTTIVNDLLQQSDDGQKKCRKRKRIKTRHMFTDTAI